MSCYWKNLPTNKDDDGRTLSTEEIVNGLASIVGERAMGTECDESVGNHELPLLKRIKEAWKNNGFSQSDKIYLKGWLLIRFKDLGNDSQAKKIAEQIIEKPLKELGAGAMFAGQVLNKTKNFKKERAGL